MSEKSPSESRGNLKIDRRKLIKWECLARQYPERQGKILDTIFENPLCKDETRIEILNSLELSVEQRSFLLNVFDIDYIYTLNKKPILMEEKTKNIEGKKFRKGNYIYCNHGTSTQYRHLKEAYEHGIEAGILLRCIKFKKSPKGLLGYALIDDKDVEFEDSRFYPIQNCIHLKYQTKISVDDFMERMRKMI